MLALHSSWTPGWIQCCTLNFEHLYEKLFKCHSIYQDQSGIERPPCNVNQMLCIFNGSEHILPKFSWVTKPKWWLEARAVVSILVQPNNAIGALRKCSVLQPLESTTAEQFSPARFEFSWSKQEHESQLEFCIWLSIFHVEWEESIDQTCFI